jgi:hypothetical protein
MAAIASSAAAIASLPIACIAVVRPRSSARETSVFSVSGR